MAANAPLSVHLSPGNNPKSLAIFITPDSQGPAPDHFLITLNPAPPGGANNPQPFTTAPAAPQAPLTVSWSNLDPDTEYKVTVAAQIVGQANSAVRNSDHDSKPAPEESVSASNPKWSGSAE